ncbi:MAG TPA: WS/DGAT domain-containing protein, partial [Mesorhizobium sp.]|nr:WS/DGAT domain-containing protein [Mesorhizobium sp.]
GLPILPPGAGLNITFASVTKDICLAIGAAPEAVHEPFRLAQLIEEAFHKLQAEAESTPPRTARRPHQPA